MREEYVRRTGRAVDGLANGIVSVCQAKEARLRDLSDRLDAAQARIHKEYGAAFKNDVIQRSQPFLADLRETAFVPRGKGNPERDKVVTEHFAQNSKLPEYMLAPAARAETAALIWLHCLLRCKIVDVSFNDQYSLHDLSFYWGGETILIDVKNCRYPQDGSAHLKDIHGRHLQNIVFLGTSVVQADGDATILGQLSRQDADEITAAFSKIEGSFYGKGYNSVQSVVESGKACAWMFSLNGDVLPDQLACARSSLSQVVQEYPYLNKISEKPSLEDKFAHLRMILPEDIADYIICSAEILTIQNHFRQRLREIGCKGPRLFHIFLLTIEYFLDLCGKSDQNEASFPPFEGAFCGPHNMVCGNYDPVGSYVDLLLALRSLWGAGLRNLKIEKLTVFPTGTIVANMHHGPNTKKFPRHTVYARCKCSSKLVFGQAEVNRNGFLVCTNCQEPN